MRSALAIAALLAGIASADEAVLRNGQRVEGSLSLTSDKRWQFVPAGKTDALAVASIHHVRFPDTDVPPLRAGLVQRVALRDGTALTGVVLSLDAKQLDLRTAWSEKLAVPRPTIASIRSLPGWAPVYLYDFSLKLPGKPPTGTGVIEGPAGGTLTVGAGSRFEFSLPRQVEAGRVGINFDHRDAEGATWLAEAEFRTKNGPRVVSVVVAGADHEARVPGLNGSSNSTTRTRGWRRLDIRFSPTSLRISIDDISLWNTLESGPGGPLDSVRLKCPIGKTARGSAHFTDLAVLREDDEPRRPKGDPSQDELWLRDGDQVFGHVADSNYRSIGLEGSFGTTSFLWRDVRGLFFSDERKAARKDERIRLWIDGGAGGEPDTLEGNVTAWDAKRCRLRHPDLGELDIDRSRIRRLYWEPAAAKE